MAKVSEKPPPFLADKPLPLELLDPLGFGTLALGISRFLRNERTVPPLTLAVVGDWGAGKSSLLALVREQLRSHDWPVVWFNAWQHESEQDLLAALLQRLGDAVPPWWRLRGIIFHGRLLVIRVARRQGLLASLAAIVCLVSAYLAMNPGADLVAAATASLPSSESFWQVGQSAWLWLLAVAPVLALVISLADLLWKGRTLSGHVGGAELRRKRDFPTRVAEDLRDIAQALKPASITLLIDDLDRCRPRAIVNVLEAVHFVVSASECFVIVGMARDVVERSIRIHLSTADGNVFKDRTEETVADDENSPRLRMLSTRYLERFINLEIPLPQPVGTPLLAPVAVSPSSAAWPTAPKRLGLIVALFISALVVGGVLGSHFPPPTAALPVVSVGDIRISWLVAAWFSCLAGVGLLAGVYVVARAVEGIPHHLRVPRGQLDAGDLEAALAVWSPLIHEFAPTPRPLKQFLNHVRLLAEMAGEGDMPSANLVALVVLYRLVPSLIESDDFNRALATFTESGPDPRVHELVSAAAHAHAEHFGEWPPPAEQVARLRTLLTRTRL